MLLSNKLKAILYVGGKASLAAGAGLALPILCAAQTIDFPDYAYDYRVPCKLGGYEGFKLSKEQFHALKVVSYEGNGELILNNSTQYNIQDAGQCFLSTAKTFKTLQEQIAGVKQKLDALDDERANELGPIDEAIEKQNSKYSEYAAKVDLAYEKLNEKKLTVENDTGHKIDKTYEDLNRALEEFETQCEEEKLTKLTLAQAIAKIDSIIAATQSKIDQGLGKILSLEANQYNTEVAAVNEYFASERASLTGQLQIAQAIRNLNVQKANILLKYSNKKLVIAKTLEDYRDEFESSKSTPYLTQSLDKLYDDLYTSANNFQVTLADKTCKFSIQTEQPENIRDFRLYYTEQPNICRCEFSPRDLNFDCYQLLGTTNVALDVCQLLPDQLSTRTEDCVSKLDSLTYVGDLSMNSSTSWIVDSLQNLRVIRYKLSNVKPIRIDNPIDPTPPKVRVKEHKIK